MVLRKQQDSLGAYFIVQNCMADIYHVTIKSKTTGEEITRDYDLDYVDEKNRIISEMWNALKEAREEKF